MVTARTSKWCFSIVIIAVIAETLSPVLQPSRAADLSPKPASAHQLAQSINAPIMQGNQLVLNNRSIPANWSQWQTQGRSRIALSDAALIQLFGVELLSTNDASQQPVHWFSNASSLATRFVSPLRYIDITELAQRAGWQIQTNGNTLQISTPSAKVLEIQQGPSANSPTDQIVVRLDRAVPYQIDQQSQELLLTIDAAIDPALAKTFKPNPASLIRSLRIEAAPKQTILRIGIPITLRPRLTTASSQITIEVGANPLAPKDILWANGLRWRQQYFTVGGAQLPIVWLEANPRQPGLSLRPILPNDTTVEGTAPLIQTAQKALATAAINGGYFNRNELLPLGVVRLENRFVSGPILNRGVVGWDNTENFRFDRLALQETLILSSGQRFPLTTLNSGYVQAGIARYTSDWGTTYTTLSDNEILLTVQNNQVATQQTIQKAGSAVPIPTTGYLLIFRSNRTAANSFTVGLLVRLESTLSPSAFSAFPNIVGAGPLLIQNGQIVLDGKAERFSDAFVQERAARSAIGQTADGRILIVSAQNRTLGAGATLSEMAQIMQQLGAVNALNLDGGSSTTLYLGGQILDRPPRSSARVHNGIGIFLQP